VKPHLGAPLADKKKKMSNAMKAVYSGTVCSRDTLNSLFTVTNPYSKSTMTIQGSIFTNLSSGVYDVEKVASGCSSDCADQLDCVCSTCHCCCYCSEACECRWADTDPDSKLASLLGLGSQAYRLDSVAW
jgi:hypothetical protein